MVMSLNYGNLLLDLGEIKYKLCSIHVLYTFFILPFEVAKLKL